MLVFVLDVEMSDVDGLVVSEVRENGKLDDELDRLEVTFETEVRYFAASILTSPGPKFLNRH